MEKKKTTHNLVKNPKISARYLADYMAASERGKRSIITRCKYPALVRVTQHNEAKSILSNFMIDGNPSPAILTKKAQDLRDRWTDDSFQRDTWDHNADYIDRFVEVLSEFKMPAADVVKNPNPAIELKGVKVTADIHFHLRKLGKDNKALTGAGMFRYAKGKALSTEVAEWQSAFIHGYLNEVGSNDNSTPDRKLCLTVDAYTGQIYAAPSNSPTRFKNMEAACESIAERWPQIKPPPKAVFE